MGINDLEKLFNSIYHKAKERGFFHIIISSSLVKIVSFISALFLPRYLAKPDYGLLIYVDNLLSYGMLINGLGIANATLRYCAQDDDDGLKKGYFITSLITGVIFDVIMILFAILVIIVVPFPIGGSKPLLLFISCLPLLSFVFEDIQLLLRACFENQKYSILSFIYSVSMVALQIGAAVLWNLNGVVAARYVAITICIIIGAYLVKDLKVIRSQMVLPDRKQIAGMIKFGIIMLAANATSLVMQLNEIFIIGQVLKDKNALAEYKVASYILQISLFIVQSMIIFVFPYFVKHKADRLWIWVNFKKLFSLNAVLMIPFHVVLIIFSKSFITVLFGNSYLNSVPIMQMLLVASLGQSVFRGLAGNTLAAIGEEKYNLKINIGFTILHAALDVWAIRTFGIAGAAVALTFVYFTSGIVMLVHLKKVSEGAGNYSYQTKL